MRVGPDVLEIVPLIVLLSMYFVSASWVRARPTFRLNTFLLRMARLRLNRTRRPRLPLRPNFAIRQTLSNIRNRFLYWNPVYLDTKIGK